MKRGLVLLALALGGSASGCDANEPAGEGRVRVVHAVPDVPEVDVLLDGTEVAGGVSYLEATSYQDAPAGIRAIQIRAAGTSAALVSSDVPVADAADYTVIAGGLEASIEPIVLEDDNSLPAAGHAKLRTIHLGPSAPAVDLYFTTPGADLANETPLLANLGFGDSPQYRELTGDVIFQVRATVAGSKTVVFDMGLNVFLTGDVLTAMVVEAAGGGAPLTLATLRDRSFADPPMRRSPGPHRTSSPRP
jgi:hypothetical protein